MGKEGGLEIGRCGKGRWENERWGNERVRVRDLEVVNRKGGEEGDGKGEGKGKGKERMRSFRQEGR